MIPPSWIAVLVLTAALAASGLLLKGQIQTNGELKQSIAETSAALERVAGVVREKEAEKQRLSALLSEREETIREASKAASKGKDAIRVESVKPTDFGRCTDVLLPTDVVRGLRDGASRRDPDGQSKATNASAWGLSTSDHSRTAYVW